MRFPALALIAALLALTGGSVRADSPRIKAAREALEGELDDEKALKELQAALKDDATTPQDRALAHWLSAKAYFNQTKNKDVVKAIDNLLAIHPIFEPDENNTTPELVKIYRERAKKYRDAHKVRLAEPVVEGTHIVVPVQAGEGEIAEARALVRAKGSAEFATVKLDVADKKLSGALVTPELLEKAQQAGGLEYVVQSLTRGGMPNAEVGSEASPRLLELAAAAPAGASAATTTQSDAVTPTAATAANGSTPAEQDEGGGGRTLKAAAVGAPLLVTGVLAGVAALGLTSFGSVTTAIGLLLYQQNQLPQELRILSNAATVMGPTIGVAAVLLAVGGLLVLVLLR